MLVPCFNGALEGRPGPLRVVPPQQAPQVRQHLAVTGLELLTVEAVQHLFQRCCQPCVLLQCLFDVDFQRSHRYRTVRTGDQCGQTRRHSPASSLGAEDQPQQASAQRLRPGRARILRRGQHLTAVSPGGRGHKPRCLF